MSVIKRKKREQAFTIIDTAALRRPTISLKAKGLLALMMGFPEDWEFTMTNLEEYTLEGRDALQGAMKELIQAGYVVRTKRHGDKGRFDGWDYEVDDIPRPVPNPPTEGSTDNRETRQSENPTVGKPATTNKENTNKENTNTSTSEYLQVIRGSELKPLWPLWIRLNHMEQVSQEVEGVLWAQWIQEGRAQELQTHVTEILRVGKGKAEEGKFVFPTAVLSQRMRSNHVVGLVRGQTVVNNYLPGADSAANAAYARKAGLPWFSPGDQVIEPSTGTVLTVEVQEAETVMFDSLDFPYEGAAIVATWQRVKVQGVA